MTNAEHLLLHEVRPRLKNTIPRSVPLVGSDDAGELLQDGIVIAIHLLNNAERSGKKVTAGNIAFYTVLSLRLGRPDIDEAQILAMLEGTLANTGAFIEEAVREVFEYLRPHRSHYKTNTEFEIGKRVILSWAVETKWDGGFHVNSYREQILRAVDNVFHALDGNGTIKTHRGPLIDAIEASRTGTGETDYFKFKCYRNHNLHLEFKRLDLVARLNAVAGGMRLRGEPKDKEANPI